MANLCYLAANVEMYQLQAIHELLFLKIVDCLKQFARIKSEFALVAARLFPFAATRTRQLDADAYVRTNIQSARNVSYQAQLVELFHHKEYAAAHLLCQERKFHIALILISIADDERFLVDANR